ncbi:hypothetical protein GY45DRAFT_140138 [Cubamyces sp. BRFM 1775]|nr:hypothetical protein GY45DRAFT_140138 [Cubamyces sp. BRFM 1775]
MRWIRRIQRRSSLEDEEITHRPPGLSPTFPSTRFRLHTYLENRDLNGEPWDSRTVRYPPPARGSRRSREAYPEFCVSLGSSTTHTRAVPTTSPCQASSASRGRRRRSGCGRVHVGVALGSSGRTLTMMSMVDGEASSLQYIVSDVFSRRRIAQEGRHSEPRVRCAGRSNPCQCRQWVLSTETGIPNADRERATSREKKESTKSLIS